MNGTYIMPYFHKCYYGRTSSRKQDDRVNTRVFDCRIEMVSEENFTCNTWACALPPRGELAC
ncbi:hypothetical protein PR048_016407 [Dryococelus australis]|uniref:Uncharacterized protein n=1 Tax=Dryococelus australis TaxID=614101 RepID=A0ABQ9HJM7_9NEOP|nr:hypothetical protein PR048_016407 [Dryococelus australis]